MTANLISGKYMEDQGRAMYMIDNYDQMSPFFMSLISDSDLWMYLSSTGCLSAGRNNPDQTIFPAYIIHHVDQDMIERIFVLPQA